MNKQMLREVKVEEAVGAILPHDLTQILPGQFKGRLFKKGHRITEEDIPALLSIGKEHIYVMEPEAGYLHEDEAALRMAAAIQDSRMSMTEPHEGKVTLRSSIHGLTHIDPDWVHKVNSIENIVMSTLKDSVVVEPGQPVAGTRIIPLYIEETRIEQIEETVRTYREKHGCSPVRVEPFLNLKVGLITTGSEVYKGRIQDKFGPVVRRKVAELGSEVVEQRLAPDEADIISRYILELADGDIDLILVTRGMSVDPDDRTPGAIRQTGARVVNYGTPMLPGSMLMMAYLGDVPVMGLPGCVMHDPYTSFDVLLPRICAGRVIRREEITGLGYGGLQGC